MAKKRNTDTNGVQTDETGTATLPPPETPTETAAPSEAEAPISDTNGNGAEPNGQAKRRPVYKFGPYAVDKTTNISVAIWDKQLVLQDGREITVYSVTMQCSYYDPTGGEHGRGAWVNTPYYRGSALPIASHALLKAYDWILEARNEARQQPF